MNFLISLENILASYPSSAMQINSRKVVGQYSSKVKNGPWGPFQGRITSKYYIAYLVKKDI